MRRFWSGKVKWLVPISGLLAAAMALVLLFAGRGPLFGQSEEKPIPDMRGAWQGEIAGYVFKNVFDPDEQPQYVEDASEESLLRMEVQTGRAFAGSTPDGGKFTGVVLPDGTVHMQAFGEGELRMIITATLAVHAGKYEMTGHAHMFDDLADWVDAPDMGTFYVRSVKQD